MILATVDTGSQTLDFIAYIAQWGLIGLLLLDVGVTRKVFVPKWTLDREQAERERERADHVAQIAELKAQVTRMTDLTEGQVIPALTRTADLAKEYVQSLQQSSQRRHDQ